MSLPYDTPRWVDLCYDSVGHLIGAHPEAEGINVARFLPLWVLFAVMNQRGITQAELARHMGLSRERVSQLFLIAADNRHPEQAEQVLMRLDDAVTTLTDELIGCTLPENGSTNSGNISSLLPLFRTFEPAPERDSS